MKVKITVSTAFVLHALLGSFCTMPMAFAQGMEMPHEDHMEMDMTPIDTMSMVPMSPAHCEHCAKMQSGHGEQSPQSGCAGHCFDQAHSTMVSTVTFNAPHIVAATLMPITIAFDPQTNVIVTPPSTAPPTSIHTKTTVLRL